MNGNMLVDIKKEYIYHILSLVENKEFVEYTIKALKDITSPKLLDELIFNLENITEKTYPNKKIDKLKKCILKNIEKIDNVPYAFDENGKIFGKLDTASKIVKLTDEDIKKFSSLNSSNMLHSQYFN